MIIKIAYCILKMRHILLKKRYGHLLLQYKMLNKEIEDILESLDKLNSDTDGKD